jgi:hypothetical protein
MSEETWFVFHISMMMNKNRERKRKESKKKKMHRFKIKNNQFIFFRERNNEPELGMNQTMKIMRLGIKTSLSSKITSF